MKCQHDELTYFGGGIDLLQRISLSLTNVQLQVGGLPLRKSSLTAALLGSNVEEIPCSWSQEEASIPCRWSATLLSCLIPAQCWI